MQTKMIVSIGKMMERRMKSVRLSFAGLWGWERFMSRTQKVWKSGLTVDRRMDMIVAVLEMIIGR